MNTASSRGPRTLKATKSNSGSRTKSQRLSVHSRAKSSSSETRKRTRVRLVHWNKEEGEQLSARLHAAGYIVEFDHGLIGPVLLGKIKENPPDVYAIDLSRLPSQGRDAAMVLRSYKPTRNIPILFVGGDLEKVERIKKQLTDALYTDWGHFRSAIRHVFAHPLPNPIVPRTSLEGYSGTPLWKKLGIKRGAKIGLVGAPERFEENLGTLPSDVTFVDSTSPTCDLTVWFLRSQEALRRDISRMAPFAENGGLWIAWPKRASGITSDVSENTVREVGLEAGLVDYKICSIDATWSGLRFTWRRRDF